jgi:hypothetical protein
MVLHQTRLLSAYAVQRVQTALRKSRRIKVLAALFSVLAAAPALAQTGDEILDRAFSGGEEVVYLGLESTSEEDAMLERSTFTPVLGDLPFSPDAP